MEFYTFRLEQSGGCALDYLKITDKAGDSLLQQSCGTGFYWPHYPDKIVSRKNDMTIRFKTDSSLSYQGFNATIRAVQPSPHLFVIAKQSTIRVVYRYNNKNFAPQLNDQSDPQAVDYDPRTQFVFYSDRGTKTIDKFHVERRSLQIVLHSENISEPLGLRIDVNSRLLYWTDAERSTISVSNLDGEYRNTLVNTDLDKPSAIVTEPYKGFIYFTDRGTDPKIERADADGTNRLILVNTLIVSPRSLAIDLKERALYWIDSAQKSLERVNYDGTGRTLLKLVAELNVFSLVLDDDAFFWSGYSPSNESIGYIYFLDRSLDTNRYTVRWIPDKYYKGLSLRPYGESGNIIPDTCPTPTCSGLCIPKPNGNYTCLNDDVTPPVFQNCPDTIYVFVAPGMSSSFVSWNKILLTDDNDFIVSSSHVSGSEFFLGSETVTIVAKDLAGNTAWCTFSVTVNDDETPPVFQNCPDTISVWAAPGNSSCFVSWNKILLKDDNDYIVSSSHLSGSEFFLGSETVAIAAKDLAGNKAWCNFSVTVNEHTPATPSSLTMYFVICIGGVLIVLVFVAVTLQVVYVVCKLRRQHGRYNSNQSVDNECIHHTYSGDVLFSGGSVQYIKPKTDPYYSNYQYAY
ncbi:Low-density lipoprotein receptor-related protein 6 [Holothuria leucospilota]|uniref:Low-density lipoprotein receptor-related protein 6 n=1 Tax=Holothuria leucospilota TaxID=206669 RepID=A0A9Q1C4C2_HOLLE|nr:Low-density lipoprotein receptor-related protein 6 [Holothuria leucospilota]